MKKIKRYFREKAIFLAYLFLRRQGFIVVSPGKSALILTCGGIAEDQGDGLYRVIFSMKPETFVLTGSILQRRGPVAA